MSTWWAIDRAVRCLNSWNDLNLGGVGQDINDETVDHAKIDWPSLAKQVLEHFGRPATTATTRATTSVPNVAQP
ncbi:MAG: hypothetical protein GXY38_05155 [Planctomycetes bacterium]|nr:hypothetical protein [Planctomycetota bacterium]